MIVDVHPINPERRKILNIKNGLLDGGVFIIPTDSVYALVCAMNDYRAVDRICKLKGLNPVKANLTFMCYDIAQVSTFTAPLPNQIFRLLKRNTPGPFTFILKSNNKVPKLFKNKKRTIGARIPAHTFLQTLIREIECPLMSTSLKSGDDEYYLTIEEIAPEWEKRVDAIIDCGPVAQVETAIIDATTNEIEIIREGKESLRR